MSERPAAPPTTPRPAWAESLTRLDAAWVRLEVRLAIWVVVAEMLTLVSWVAIKGLATTTNDTNVIGLLFRAGFGAAVLAVIANFATRGGAGTPAGLRRHRLAVSGAVVLGLLGGKLWTGLGVAWASNVVEWLQNASAFALIGGPRGAVTRLTLWLALLGASLAASTGKHINIDVALRFLPPRFVTPAAVISWLAAALVCFAATFGFVDSIAVTKFKAEAFTACGKGSDGGGGQLCDTPVANRLAVVARGSASDFFLLRRQLSLDAMSLPKVIAGSPYDKYLDANAWNQWVKEGGWERYFPAAAVHSLMVPTDNPELRKMPAVIAPDSGEGRDLLIRDLDFILPFGLLMVGLKLILRIFRVVSGEVHVEAGEAQHEDELVHSHDPVEEPS
ncbi:MAG: TRAP transporter small permease subunit [Myxococcota bacterium]